MLYDVLNKKSVGCWTGSRASQSSLYGYHCACLEARLMIGIGRRGPEVRADCGGGSRRHQTARARVRARFNHHSTSPSPETIMPLLLGHLPRIHPPPHRSSTTNPLKVEPVLALQTRTRFQSMVLADFVKGRFSSNGIRNKTM